MNKFVSILIALLFLTASCGKTKKLVHTKIETRDSIIYKETVRVDTVKIKAAEVEGEIDMSMLKDSIGNLQSFIDQLNYKILQNKVSTGSRAGVQFRIDTGAKKVYIKGTCDSGEILSMRNSIESYKTSLVAYEKKELEKKTNGYSLWDMIVATAISFFGGIGIYKILKYTRILS